MVKQIIEGTEIQHRKPLNVERCAEVNPADDIMIDAGNDGWITHAAPGAAFTWVVSQVTVAFDIMPTGAFRLEMTYDLGPGAVTVFDSYVGAAAPANGTDVNTMGVFGFYFPVSRKFPANSEVVVTLYSGDGAVASSMNLLSWVEMEL